jgi:membrane-associated phospholipid phosphatase
MAATQTAESPATTPDGSPATTVATRAPSRWMWRRWRMYRTLDRRARVVAFAVLLLLGGFTLLALMLRHAAGTAFDVAITRWVQQFENPAFAALMQGISALGYRPWSDVMLIGAIGGCLAARWYREAAFVVVTQGAGWLAASIKLLIERPRPTSELVRVLGHVGETSYPSGHVTSYVVLYGLLFGMVYVRARRGWRRTLLLTTFGVLVGLVGISRIYLGHHWASDVAGGYALGGAYLLVLLEAYRWVGLKRVSPPTPQPATLASSPADAPTPDSALP